MIDPKDDRSCGRVIAWFEDGEYIPYVSGDGETILRAEVFDVDFLLKFFSF